MTVLATAPNGASPSPVLPAGPLALVALGARRVVLGRRCCAYLAYEQCHRVPATRAYLQLLPASACSQGRRQVLLGGLLMGLPVPGCRLPHSACWSTARRCGLERWSGERRCRGGKVPGTVCRRGGRA